MNEHLIAAALNDTPLSRGVYPFTPPLTLKAGRLRGQGKHTVLKPMNTGAITIANGLAEDHDVKTGLPSRLVISDLRLEGQGVAANGYGLILDGACIRLERVDVLNFFTGIAVKWAVDVTLEDCLLTRNGCSLYIPGALDSWLTTFRVKGGSIRESGGIIRENVGPFPSVLIQAGQGLVFEDVSIESNKGLGLKVEQRPDLKYPVRDIECHRVWFENNTGGHYQDDVGALTLTKCRLV